MLLRKENLPGRTLCGTPYLHAPLQRAHLPVLKATGILSLQELEHRLGLEPCVVLKQLLHIVPNFDERIGPCPTAYRRRKLAGHPAMTAILSRSLGIHSCF